MHGIPQVMQCLVQEVLNLIKLINSFVDGCGLVCSKQTAKHTALRLRSYAECTWSSLLKDVYVDSSLDNIMESSHESKLLMLTLFVIIYQLKSGLAQATAAAGMSR